MEPSEMCAKLRRHFANLGQDQVGASEIYAEDAILEFVHTGERIRGKANIDAARQAYPGPPASFEVHRVVCVNDLGVVEMTLRFAGIDPHPVVAILDLRDDQIVVERRYIAEPGEPAPHRAQWVELAAPHQRE